MNNEISSAEKKKEALRVLIFTVLVFAMSLGIGAYYIKNDLSSFLLMLTPLTAAVITKLVTKDKPRDLNDLLIVTNFGKAKKYYFYALAIGIIPNLVTGIAFIAIFGGEYSFGEYFLSEDSKNAAAAIPLMLSESVFLIAIFLGEEYGWRAFLTPKLEKLMPGWAAMIVQGVIWGMWHKPVLDMGQNFGKSLPFYPYSNYALMCVGCIAMGILLSWLTKKSGSIFPAALCHAALDEFVSLTVIFVPAEIIQDEKNLPVFGFSVIAIIPFIIIAAYGIVKLINKPCQEAAAA